MASSPIISWQIDGERMETVREFTLLGSKITTDGDCSHEMKRHSLEGKVMINLDSILKSRGTTDQIANLCWTIEKAREFQKNIYFCFTDYAKVFDCVDHNKLWKILQEIGIPDHLTCLLRNLYAGQEATDRTGHGSTDGFHIGKGVNQVYMVTLLI